MKSSINFQPVKSTSQSHNLRLREFDYVRKDLTHSNYSAGSKRPHSEIIAELKTLVKEKTGRTAQEKAVFIKEGVFLIKPEHTDKELFQATKKFGEKFNIKVLEMHVHRDEGHWSGVGNEKVWKPNLHAHLVIENIDRNTGKSLGWQKNDMVLIQDYFAESLEMERGQKSTKKHIDSKTWKIQKLEDEIKLNRDVLSNDVEKAEQTYYRIENYLDGSLKTIDDELEFVRNKIFADLARKSHPKAELILFMQKHPDYERFKKLYALKNSAEETKKSVKNQNEEAKRNRGRRI